LKLLEEAEEDEEEEIEPEEKDICAPLKREPGSFSSLSLPSRSPPPALSKKKRLGRKEVKEWKGNDNSLPIKNYATLSVKHKREYQEVN
jgi:hypothetical protein